MGMSGGNEREEFGKIIKQHRVMKPLMLQELARMSGVSQSHLGRIERGERFPSAAILRKIAKPLGFTEDELFTLAGYLSPRLDTIAETQPSYSRGQLDPYVLRALAQEPLEVQRAVIGILAVLKSISKTESQIYKQSPS